MPALNPKRFQAPTRHLVEVRQVESTVDDEVSVPHHNVCPKRMQGASRDAAKGLAACKCWGHISSHSPSRLSRKRHFADLPPPKKRMG